MPEKSAPPSPAAAPAPAKSRATTGAAAHDERMAVAAVSGDSGLRWIDGRELPLEGRAFPDAERFYDRLPASLPDGVNDGVRSLQRNAAGLQFRFATDSARLSFRWTLSDQATLGMDHMPASGVSGIDVYRFDAAAGRWLYAKTGRVAKPGEARLEMPWRPGEACIVNLPLYNGVDSFALGVEPGAAVRPLGPRRSGVEKPVVFYGTSITQGGCASRPGMSFVNIVGRELDVPVVNLGFSGSGVMERGLAAVVARVDASCYVLDCLWNMGTTTGETADAAHGRIKGRNVEENYEPFLRDLLALRPGVPVVLAGQCDVFCGPPNVKERFVEALCARLRAEGAANLHFLPGAGMFPPDGEGTVDGVHPNDHGMLALARAYGGAVARALGLPRP